MSQMMAKIYIVRLHPDSKIKTLHCILQKTFRHGTEVQHQLYDPWQDISYGVTTLQPVYNHQNLAFNEDTGQFQTKIYLGKH